eukprot:TRINITY_DN9735_c0_g1_i4.p2 TRINITY_DN9735_c0_g1~~TRINITY_DN9735_c0_g1_i4.p2  ORF type:complete len:188 (+),score=57.16 TRINITY_DN9735_c0_g1_i4:2922-3485(+)
MDQVVANIGPIFRFGQIGCSLGAAGLAMTASSNGNTLMSMLATSTGIFMLGMVLTAAAAGFFFTQEKAHTKPSTLDAYKEGVVGFICLMAATCLAASWADALEREVAQPSTAVDTAVGMGYFAFYMCNFSAVTVYQKSTNGDEEQDEQADDDQGEDEYDSQEEAGSGGDNDDDDESEEESEEEDYEE